MHVFFKESIQFSVIDSIFSMITGLIEFVYNIVHFILNYSRHSFDKRKRLLLLTASEIQRFSLFLGFSLLSFSFLAHC